MQSKITHGTPTLRQREFTDHRKSKTSPQSHTNVNLHQHEPHYTVGSMRLTPPNTKMVYIRELEQLLWY